MSFWGNSWLCDQCSLLPDLLWCFRFLSEIMTKFQNFDIFAVGRLLNPWETF